MVWPRIRRWVVRPFFWSLAAVAFVLLCLRAFLSSDFARERIAVRLEQQLSQILHREVRLGRLDFELLPFALRIEDFSISGPAPADPLLLSIRRLRIDADLDALRNKLLDLQTVSAQGVRMHLELYPDGSDNLPRVAAGGGNGRFEVRIGGLFVEDGEFELDDRRVPLAVSAHSLLLRLSGLGGTELQGNLTAQEVVTTLPKALPWPATLTAKVRLRDDRVEIRAARVRSPDLDARVAGFVGWRGGTNGEIHGVVEAEGRFLDDLGYLSGEIAGPLRFEGAVRFAHKDIGLTGRLISPGIDLFGLRLDELAGEVASGGPRISSLGLTLERAVFAGGPVAGTFDVDFERPGPFARLVLQADGPHLQSVLAALDLPAPALSASAHGEVHYEFPLNDARRGVGEATLALRALPSEVAGALPVDGTAILRMAEGRLELQEVELASKSQRISLRGAYDLIGKQGELVVEVASEDLGQVARLQPFVETVPWPLWLPDSGRGGLSANIALGGPATSVRLALDLADLHAPGGSAARAAGSLILDQKAVRELGIELTRGTSSLRVTGSVPFAPGGAGAGSGAPPPLALAIDFQAWPLAEAMPWLPAPLPLAGAATGSLHLGGSIGAMTGQMHGTIAPVTVAGVGFDRLESDLDWDADRLRVQRLRLVAPTGLLTGSGELRLADEALRFAVAAERFDLAAEPWRTLTQGRLNGRAALTAQLTGTLTEPRLVVDTDLADLELPRADLGTAAAGETPALAGESPPRFAGTLHAELADRELQVKLDLPGLLTLAGGGAFVAGERGDLRFRLTSDRIDHLITIAAGQPIDGLSGTLAADLDFSFAPDVSGELTVRVPELELAYEQHRLRPLEPIVARYSGSQVVLESLYLGEQGTGDELFLSGKVDLAPAEPALDLRLQAGLSVEWLEQFLDVDLSGQVAVLATVKGTLARPEWNGQAGLTDARYIPSRLPHSFDHIDGLVLLYPGVLVLDHMRADLAGGTVTASGRLELATPAKPLAYRAQVATRGTALRYPEGWLVRGDGDFTLQSTAEGRQLAGSVTLDRVYYLQDINLSPRQLAERVLSRTRVQVDEAGELLGTTYLNISVLAPNAVRVRNNLAKLNGSANLALRGSLANPVLFGEVTTDPGGTVEYNGATYDLDRAIVTFANPTRIDPLLDVVARTKINEYQVTLSVLGSLARPTTTLASDPPLPDYDVLSLLATGTASGLSNLSETAPTGNAPGMAAETLLYGQAASLVSARVGKLFGIDRLKVDPLASGDTISAARVTIGKRLSSRVYLTYSVDPSSTAQQVLQVEWKVSDDLTLVLTQNGDESYAVDARWEKRF
ncbi:MAG: translocation/assembly module TamB domain-containing protein [Thermoanaerobaculia bacterium]